MTCCQQVLAGGQLYSRHWGPQLHHLHPYPRRGLPRAFLICYARRSVSAYEPKGETMPICGATHSPNVGHCLHNHLGSSSKHIGHSAVHARLCNSFTDSFIHEPHVCSNTYVYGQVHTVLSSSLCEVLSWQLHVPKAAGSSCHRQLQQIDGLHWVRGKMQLAPAMSAHVLHVGCSHGRLIFGNQK